MSDYNLGDTTAALRNIEQYLADCVMDEQSKCEAQNEEFFKENTMLTPEQNIVPPEDACPELDSARTHIQDAIAEIMEWRTNLERKDES